MKMDYYITVKEIGLSAFGLESYGIRIEQEREGCKSAAQCDDITLSGSEIDLIAHMLHCCNKNTHGKEAAKGKNYKESGILLGQNTNACTFEAENTAAKSAVTEEFANNAHDYKNNSITYALSKTVNCRSGDGILGGKGFGAGKNDTVNNY